MSHEVHYHCNHHRPIRRVQLPAPQSTTRQVKGNLPLQDRMTWTDWVGLTVLAAFIAYAAFGWFDPV